MIPELPVEKLRKACDPESLGCATSEDMEPLKSVIGQTRALRALSFGLSIRAPGFNVFVSGMPGTGRTVASQRYLKELASTQPVPPDWCYVNNFAEPYCPKALRLPAGKATEFRRDMSNLIQEARKEIRRVFESEEYASRRDMTVRAFQTERDALFARINEQALAQGFLIRGTPVGLVTVPIKDGKPLAEEEFAALSPEERASISQRREAVQNELEAGFRQAKALEKAAAEALQKLDQEIASFALSTMIQELQEKYREVAEVVSYIEEVRQDILENLALFRAEPDEQQPQTPFAPPGGKDAPFRRYAVNVLVDNSKLTGAPVIAEFNPTYGSLFGRLEKEAQFGVLVTDFTMIREGSLHLANGGYILIPAEELLRNIFSWDSLKRSLRTREIIVEEAGERLGFMTTKSLRPEPIPLDVKVVLIGQPPIYNLLYEYDEDFRELFKVKADFDTRMDRTDEAMHDYVAFVCYVCNQEQLRHLEASALAKIIEYGSRLADEQDKLSTRFGDLSDIIREANYYAAQEDRRYVAGEHVKRAIDERFYRSSLVRDRMQELIAQGVIKVDVEGAKVGQVNGLSVIDLGDISFGRPSRITASISLGQDGVVDIEREAKLGGPIHTKGVLILSGYLASKYAQDKPLSLSARLVFEQSYSGVEGDSASSAELYAILSSLADLPIQQGIAVTGSVNQKGEVQAIGGVNQKIEGFFDACALRGLTGKQGVIIPESNVRNLMLKDEVLEAVKIGQFHIWPVQTIDEGIEILTSVPAGKRRPDGTFEEGTVNYLVDKRLREMSEALKRFGKEEKREDAHKPQAGAGDADEKTSANSKPA